MSPPPRSGDARGRALASVSTATLAAAVVVALVEWGAGVSALVAAWGGAFVALTFLGLPLIWTRRSPEQDDPHGLGAGALARPLAIGLLASLIVLPLFALVFHLNQWLVRGFVSAGPAISSRGLVWQDRPDSIAGAVVLYEDGNALVAENGLTHAVRIRPGCSATGGVAAASAACSERTLAAGARLRFATAATAGLQVRAPGSAALQPGEVVTGGDRVPLDGGRVDVTPSPWWLLWLLAQQLIVVALPEEVFFRGWLLARLKRAWPPRRTVLGVPFGLAHVLSAAFFALIHLAAVPAPFRLLVFFPGLLFAWLRERGGSTLSPAVHHALANVVMHVLQRSYFRLPL